MEPISHPNGARRKIQPNDTVRITSGPLTGLEGIVVRWPTASRVMLAVTDEQGVFLAIGESDIELINESRLA